MFLECCCHAPPPWSWHESNALPEERHSRHRWQTWILCCCQSIFATWLQQNHSTCPGKPFICHDRTLNTTAVSHQTSSTTSTRTAATDGNNAHLTFSNRIDDCCFVVVVGCCSIRQWLDIGYQHCWPVLLVTKPIMWQSWQFTTCHVSISNLMSPFSPIVAIPNFLLSQLDVTMTTETDDWPALQSSPT